MRNTVLYIVIPCYNEQEVLNLYYDEMKKVMNLMKNVSFEFRQCGTHFIKDGKEYKLQTKDLCSQARKAGIDFQAAYEQT